MTGEFRRWASHWGEHARVAHRRSASSAANPCRGILCSEVAGILTCIGDAEAAGVPICMGKALATGNPLPKPGAQLATVATLCAVVPGTVPGPVLPWCIGIVSSGAAGVAAHWDAGLKASCSDVSSVSSSRFGGCLGHLVAQSPHSPIPLHSCPCRDRWLPATALRPCGDCIPGGISSSWLMQMCWMEVAPWWQSWMEMGLWSRLPSLPDLWVHLCPLV